MQANTLFDYEASRNAKEQGMAYAASYPFNQPVGRARAIAILLATRHGEVCADDVHRYLAERMPDVLAELEKQPNAWGSVFKSPKLEFTGRIKESGRTARHCGSQRVWKIKT